MVARLKLKEIDGRAPPGVKLQGIYTPVPAPKSSSMLVGTPPATRLICGKALREGNPQPTAWQSVQRLDKRGFSAKLSLR
jgi:hypothetical protein